MLISKSDLKTYIQFSDNIPDRLVDFHIKQVQELVIEPLIDVTMLANIEAELATPSTYPQLGLFFTNFMKAWICNNVAYSIYSQHGINITQFGVVVINEDTSTPVAPQDRANLLQTVKNNGNAYYMRMRKALEDADFTFDTIKYDDITRPKRGINLGIGRVGRKLHNPMLQDWQRFKDWC
jgi:hypothetical protein